MEEYERYLDATGRFLRSAESIIEESPEAVPLLAHRAVEHMIMALAHYYSPSEAVYLNSHGRRRSWLTKMIKGSLLPRRLLSIFDELTRIYKRTTYLLEDGELAEEALDLAREAFRITRNALRG